jgi:membrane dipeptidase
MLDTAVKDESVTRAKKVIAAHPSMDLHSHLGYWEGKGLTDIFDLVKYSSDDQIRNNIQDMLDGGCKSLQICVTGDNPILNLGYPGNKTRDYEDNEAWEEYLRERANLQEFFDTMPITLAKHPDEIETLNAKGELAAFLTTEGGHMVENDISRLSDLYTDGVRRFQPIHYVHTKLGDSQTDPSHFGGLSPVGKQAIREAVKMGMVIDAAHASFEAAKNMAEIAAAPIMLSHTMLKYNSAKYGSYLETRPRFITSDHAFLIAQTGGVIGTWLCVPPYGVETLDAYAEAVARLVDTVGIDHVGWSTDYIDSSMPDFFNDYKRFPVICAALLDVGFSDEDLAKFIGGNAIRVINEASSAWT